MEDKTSSATTCSLSSHPTCGSCSAHGKPGKNQKTRTGRCEKYDLETWSNFGLEKTRARVPYKRPLDLRHTFRFRRNFSEIDFFTSSRPEVTQKRARLSEEIVTKEIVTDQGNSDQTGRSPALSLAIVGYVPVSPLFSPGHYSPHLNSTHPNRSCQGKPPPSPCHPDRSSEGAQWRDLQFPLQPIFRNSSHYLFPSVLH